MLLVQKSLVWLSKITFCVSIHYMLLVQTTKSAVKATLEPFQYIICCWFNEEQYEKYLDNFSFNTLYVVGSTPKILINLAILAAFQYIICCWFNNSNF